MNTAMIEQIVKAVLYEGYLLYPYRASALKNRRRWNFGVVYPHRWSETAGEPWHVQSEVLVAGDRPRLDVYLRFLHLATHREGDKEWQEAFEREAVMHDFDPSAGPRTLIFDFPAGRQLEPGVERSQEAVSGLLEVMPHNVREGVWKLAVRISNTTPLPECNAEAALLQSLASAHAVLHVRDGAFASLLDPGEAFAADAAACAQVGLWPVLVGANAERDTMLCSPIILYDYPQVAPESAGDLFDGTEIDEILSLRILTLTDDEKREIREGDERSRRILERTEALSPEHWMKLHGAVRSVEPKGPQ